MSERVAGTRLVSVAGARPTTVRTAAELGAPFGKDAAWVTSRTGIGSLRRLAPGESVEQLAVDMGRRALERAGMGGTDGIAPVDLVVTASCSRLPEHGRRIAARLAPRAAWFEVNSACSGFCYGVAAADSLIRVGDARVALVVAVEQMSRLLDPEDLGTSIIFGDGAGAAVVAADGAGDGAGEGAAAGRIGPLVSGSDGGAAGLIHNDAHGWLRMQGRSVFRWAVDTVPEIARAACRRAGVALSQIEVFVPHQANLRIVEAVVRRLGLDHAVVATDVTTSGNTSAASIPLALDALLAARPALHGRLALLVGFGAGLTYAAQVVRLPMPGVG